MRARLGGELSGVGYTQSRENGEVFARASLLARLNASSTWDFVVIGGGASGLGCALDAAARGYSILLVEARDFAAGTSSRSSKLIHGGVRYLAQGRLALVREALVERGRLLCNAADLVHPLRFVVPTQRWSERAWMGLGLGLYDLLAGADGLGRCRLMSAADVRTAMPTLRAERALGGVAYWDAQFDDAALAVALARTAILHGALVLNHCALESFALDGGRIGGLTVRERESGRTYRLGARAVINATGVWSDNVMRMLRPDAPQQLRPSQGVHIVIDADFLSGADAVLLPHTDDGRVVFLIPWQGRVLVGTTDTPRDDLPAEPEPMAGEIDFLLETVGRYLRRAPTRADVRSVFVGLRPLLGGGAVAATGSLSREHRVDVSEHGLVSVLGGKWTTYRSMAEHAVDVAEEVAGFAHRPSVTDRLRLDSGGLWRPDMHGEAALGAEDGVCASPFVPSAEEVRHAVRAGLALGVEDVLARRSRCLFLDAEAARRAAPGVAAVMARQRGWSQARTDAERSAFEALAARYRARSATVATSPPSG